MNTILVVNAGSSSVKFQLYASDASGWVERLVKGSIDGVGTQPRLRGEGADGEPLVDRSFEAKEVANIPAAM
jgi:acetate kinase